MSDTTAADRAEAEAWVEATITAHCACVTYGAGVKAYLAGLAAGRAEKQAVIEELHWQLFQLRHPLLTDREQYENARADRVIDRFKPGESQVVLDALRRVTDEKRQRYREASERLEEWTADTTDFDDRVAPVIEEAIRKPIRKRKKPCE